MTKFAVPRPCADPDAAARRLVQLAASIEPVQDDRIQRGSTRLSSSP